MTDDAELLASAYLDDEVTADERARVEADPVLLAEVDRLRVVRDALVATDPAPISVREDHLASALGAWDRLPEAERLGTRDDTGGADATTVAAASAMSGSMKGRSRRRWVLGAAAALMVVVGAGVVLTLPNGVQPFANFRTLLGHRYFDNYVGTVGLRIAL